MMKVTEMAVADARARGYDVMIVDDAGYYWEESFSGEWIVSTEYGWELDPHAFDGAEVISENYCDEEKICYIRIAGEF